MNNCPSCNHPLSPNSAFCSNCGASFVESNTQTQFNQAPPVTPVQPQYQQQYQQAPVNIYDHTNEFSAEDVANHKLFALAIYILSTFGIIVSLFYKEKSPYLQFHIKQGLKMLICDVILIVLAYLFCWTIIVPIAAFVCVMIIFVVNIICFFKVANNKSIEVPIIRSLGFLK